MGGAKWCDANKSKNKDIYDFFSECVSRAEAFQTDVQPVAYETGVSCFCKIEFGRSGSRYVQWRDSLQLSRLPFLTRSPCFPLRPRPNFAMCAVAAPPRQ